jgi:hypothetical protein
MGGFFYYIEGDNMSGVTFHEDCPLRGDITTPIDRILSYPIQRVEPAGFISRRTVQYGRYGVVRDVQAQDSAVLRLDEGWDRQRVEQAVSECGGKEMRPWGPRFLGICDAYCPALGHLACGDSDIRNFIRSVV